MAQGGPQASRLVRRLHRLFLAEPFNLYTSVPMSLLARPGRLAPERPMTARPQAVIIWAAANDRFNLVTEKIARRAAAIASGVDGCSAPESNAALDVEVAAIHRGSHGLARRCGVLERLSCLGASQPAEYLVGRLGLPASAAYKDGSPVPATPLRLARWA